jgi:hypothetical protein
MLRRVGTKILGGRLRIRSNCCGCVRGRTQPACGSKSRAPGSAILLVLLAASCWSAFLPLGFYNTALNLVDRRRHAACARDLPDEPRAGERARAARRLRGLLWVVFLFVLTFADYLSRRPY